MIFKVHEEKLFEGREQAFGITIDGPDSLDLDDAIWLEKTGKEHIAHISIADVGSVILPETQPDKRAYERGFTHYYRKSNKPMLPRGLSENSLSLHEGVKRPAITISVPIKKSLEPGSPVIRRTYLTNTRKLSYEQADQLMETEESLFLSESFRLARKLFEKRKVNGAIVFFDKSRGLTTSEEGNPVILDKSERYNSHLIIQEFMILANQAIAGYFACNNIQGIFRNHTARPVALERSELLADIATTLLDGDPDRMNTLRQKLSIVLNRAVYAPTISGHYGLNLPAYIHFTSPIRRFADLVNSRQLTAVLRGKNPPYNSEHLFTISEKLNELEKEIRDKKVKYFKEKARKEARKMLESGKLEELENNGFYRILKVFSVESVLSPEVALHIGRRLDAGKLLARDIYTILFECNKNDPTWISIRAKIMKWLENNPHEAVSVLMLLTQESQCASPGFEKSTSGPDNMRTFRYVGSITIEENTYTSEPQTASSKKLAEQLACLGLLEKILGIESESRNITKKEEISISYILPAEDYKSILHSKCQRQNWEAPLYESKCIGPSHKPEFSVVAEININETVYSSDPSAGPNLRQAEQLAAASLLDKLPEEKKIIQTQITVRDGNFINALQEFHQKNLMDVPVYGFKEQEKGVLCECAAFAPDGSKRTYSAEGPNKKEAKKAAAHLAFNDLVPLYTNG